MCLHLHVFVQCFFFFFDKVERECSDGTVSVCMLGTVPAPAVRRVAAPGGAGSAGAGGAGAGQCCADGGREI